MPNQVCEICGETVVTSAWVRLNPLKWTTASGWTCPECNHLVCSTCMPKGQPNCKDCVTKSVAEASTRQQEKTGSDLALKPVSDSQTGLFKGDQKEFERRIRNAIDYAEAKIGNEILPALDARIVALKSEALAEVDTLGKKQIDDIDARISKHRAEAFVELDRRIAQIKADADVLAKKQIDEIDARVDRQRIEAFRRADALVTRAAVIFGCMMVIGLLALWFILKH